jgi:hypothetical protein
MKLPREILIIIYQYDSTYYEYMNINILPYIHNYLVYTFISSLTGNSLFLVIDKNNKNAIVANNLENPNYMSIHHSYNMNMFINKKKILMDSKKIDKFIKYEF